MARRAMPASSPKEQFYSKQRFKTSTGPELEYIHFDRGKPQTLIFVNGWMLRLSCWRAQMRNRDGQGRFSEYNLLFTNNRGHGTVRLGSSTPRTYLTNCANDLGELLIHIDARKINLIAHSMGGIIATEFYAAHSDRFDIQSIMFVNSAVGNPMQTFVGSPIITPILRATEGNGGGEIVMKTLENVLARLTSPILLRILYTHFRLTTGSEVSYDLFRKFLKTVVETDPKTANLALRALVLMGSEIGEKMAQITCPVLAITGKMDFLVSPGSIQILRARIPHATIEILRKSTHFPQAERPLLFNSLLHTFLSGEEMNHFELPQ
ncbi:MAG: alpha/beta hydrolase [Candidatus Micrarchaeota archaeon]